MFFFLFCSLSVPLVLNANAAINCVCVFGLWEGSQWLMQSQKCKGLCFLSIHCLLMHIFLPSFTLIHPISVIGLTILAALLLESSTLYFDWGSSVRMMSELDESFFNLVLFTASREGRLFLSNF